MLAFDTETALIEAAKLAPELACLTYSDGENVEIRHHTESYEAARWCLEQETTTANGAYDLAVLWAAFPDLKDLIWEGLVVGRYHDVLIRQKLMDIGEGCYRRVYRRLPGSDKPTLFRYSLSDLHARYYGQVMEKDEWRLRYGELRLIPLAQWPQGAIKYAQYDAVATARIHELQDKAALEQGHTNNLHDEAQQVRAAFALHLSSCWGFCTDGKQVERVIGQIDSEQPEFARKLLSAGLVREEKKGFVRNEKVAKALMFAAVGDAGELTETGYEKVKSGELTKEEALKRGYIKIDEEWCEVSKDPNLITYYQFRQNQLLRAKLEHIWAAAYFSVPIQSSFEVLMETGRTSSSENKLIKNSMALQNPPRKGGMRECFIAREGCTLIACDYGQAELVALAQITYAAFGYSKMRELLNAGRDIHVDFGKEILAKNSNMKFDYDQAWALYKAKDPQMREYRQRAKCFHGDTEVLTKFGWVKLGELRAGVEVAAATFHDEGRTEIRWEVPTQLTSRVAAELVHLKNCNIDLWVTPDHRMVAWTPKERAPLPQIRDPKTGRMVAQGGKQRNKKLVHEVCLPEELGTKRAWPSAGQCDMGTIEVPEQGLRLAVAMQADGSYEKDKNRVENGRVRFGFTKRRKIDRLTKLLEGLVYTTGVVAAAKPVSTFTLIREVSAPIRLLLDADKTLPWWWLQLTPRLREIVLDESRHWDSHIYLRGRGSWKYGSTLRKNTDVLQAIASITNRKATLSVQSRKAAEHADVHNLSVKDHANTRGGNVETKRYAWGGPVYCVTVPSDAILVRYGGNTVVTRNCADFGFPGGLGWASFQSYARKAWSIIITGEQSKQLKSFWLNHFPEMREYFKWASALVEAGNGKSDVQQYMSGRWRGKCFYTQLCNSLFQGLTADAAKTAFFEVSRLCYSARSSALYGCRPLLFLHDEIITEAPKEQAAEAAVEKEKVMVEVYSRYTPDVKITAAAHLMDRWSKDAEAVRDERGKLVPWNPPQEADERMEAT